MGLLFKMEPIATAAPKNAGPGDEVILKNLAAIVKALYPVTHMSEDPEDKRAMTNCVVYTRYPGGGYLVGTDSHCLVAVKLTDAQTQYMESDGGPAALANKCRLVWAPGTFPGNVLVKGHAYLFGGPKWEGDSGCWGANPAQVPYWPALIPTGYLTPEGLAPFNAALGVKVDNAVNAIREVYGDPEIVTGVCPRMIGDTKNATTGRVWCEKNILALVMPLIRNGAETKLADLREFIAQANQV